MDTSHLHAIELRLSNTRMRRDRANAKDKAWWDHEVRMIERELKNERAFLGLPAEKELPQMSIDEILAELDA